MSKILAILENNPVEVRDYLRGLMQAQSLVIFTSVKCEQDSELKSQSTVSGKKLVK